MRENMKKRLAVFLSILFILPAIVAVLPTTALEAQAASSVSLSWNMSNYTMSGNSRVIAVEAGQKFNIGDYVSVYRNQYGTASMMKATYASSNKSAATVDSKGNLTTKKAGKTTITVKYKGQKISCILNVEKAGSFGNSEIIETMQKEVDALVKNLPSKVTTKNGFAVRNKMRVYYNNVTDIEGSLYNNINYDGFLRELKNGYYSTTNKLAVPQAGRYNYVSKLLSAYATKNSPTSTHSAKVMKIASVSATTKGITVKLKKALTSEQILALQIENSYYNEDNYSQKKAFGYVSVLDKKTKKYYSGILTVEKGSKTAKIEIQEYKPSSFKYVKTKLKKGHTYMIGSASSWTKGKTVKVK